MSDFLAGAGLLSRPAPAPPRSCCRQAACARWRCWLRSASSRSSSSATSGTPPDRRPAPRRGADRRLGDDRHRGRGARLPLPALADPAAAGDRRHPPLPDPPPRRRRHRQPVGTALPGDRGRGPRHPAAGLELSLQPPGPPGRSPGCWPRVVVLYALQTLYSEDFSKGLQNVCFFFVPFTVAYRLLREVEWDRRLLVLMLWVVGVEATAFVLIGSVEYLTRSLFWNDQVIRSNEFHTYFRVNSVFWDPNVYGRYLALVIMVAMAALLWARERRGLRAADGADRRPLAGPGADVLAVELHRPAGRPRRSRRAALELEVDAARRSRRLGRRGARRHPGRRHRQVQLLAASTSTPAAVPTSSPAASTSSPNAPSRATAPAPSRPPTASTVRTRTPPSRSPTPSR